MARSWGCLLSLHRLALCLGSPKLERKCLGSEAAQESPEKFGILLSPDMHTWVFAQLISMDYLCNFKSDVKRNTTQKVWLILSLIQSTPVGYMWVPGSRLAPADSR